MNIESEQNTTAKEKEKEFLKINDMVEKLGVTRTQFWRMRKAGEDYSEDMVKTGGKKKSIGMLSAVLKKGLNK